MLTYLLLSFSVAASGIISITILLTTCSFLCVYLKGCIKGAMAWVTSIRQEISSILKESRNEIHSEMIPQTLILCKCSLQANL